MDNNKIIFLKNEILENENLKEYDIATYLGLRNMYIKGMGKHLINIDSILYKIYGESYSNVSNKVKKNFLDSFEHLNSLGVINIIKNCGKGNYIVNMDQLYFNPSVKNPFTTIEENEVIKLLSIDDNLKLLKYFIMLIKTVNSKDMVGFTPTDNLAKLAGISSKSVFTYNKILEDNKLIYIYHHDMIYSTGNDTISSLPNHYGRYKDKSKIKAYAKEYEEKQKNEMSDIKRKKKKAKDNQKGLCCGITIGTKKESIKEGTNDYDDNVEF